MPYIKSHSNYVLKSKHQDVNDGTIFERDITTIGAVDQFSKGQTPIYRSNNFIITVRNDGRPSNQYNSTKWKENDNGEIWTLQTVSGMVSDFDEDDDTKIVLKQDYYDFRDFAYYGSLTELFRASVGDIMARFPGELYVTNQHAYRTDVSYYDFERVEESKILGSNKYYYVSNPFGIDIHTLTKPNVTDPLKYFAENGYLNYQIGTAKSDDGETKECGKKEELEWDDIVSWEVKMKDPCDTCSCNNFKAEPLELSFDRDGGEKTVTLTFDDCFSAATASVKSRPSWIEKDDIKINGTTLTVKVNKNNIFNDRNGQIIIGATDGVTKCELKISVKQDKQLCECNDNFNNKIEFLSVQIPSGGCSNYQIGTYNVTADCITNVDITTDANWAKADIDGNNIVLSAQSLDYGSVDTTRNVTVTITAKSKDGSNCSTAATFTQTRDACDCSSKFDNKISFINDRTIPSGGCDNYQIGTYNADSCITSTAITSNQDWAEASVDGNGVILLTAQRLAYNSRQKTRQVNITITGVSKDGYNCGIDATFTQTRATCDCSKLTVNWGTAEFPSNGGKITAATYSIDSCLTETAITKSDSDWFIIDSTDNNAVVLSASPITYGEVRNGTLTISGKSVDGGNCINTTSITQKTIGCDCDEDFKVTWNGTTSFPSTSYDYIIGGLAKGECITSVTFTVTSAATEQAVTWATASLDGNNIKLHLDETTSGRSATITIIGAKSGSEQSCSSSITITQEAKNCDCDDLNIVSISSNNRNVNQPLRSLNRRMMLRNGETNNDEETKEELYRRFAEITIKTKGGKELMLYGYLGDNDEVIYLAKGDDYIGMHIRPTYYPKRKYLDRFYSECDNFERLLVNEDTNYKATFSVIRENENGYYREFVPFQFPIGYGGYNLDINGYGFDTYTSQMVEIGEYYDENFTDNLWRSMTHEAIKNFDWTYTREYNEGDEEEYVFGGQRIQKALRVFAREFDEIISYINNIKNISRVTYDERNNLPDYFLTDTVEEEGWDVKLVYPYELTEYYYGDNNEKVICEDSGDTEWTEGGTSCDGQLNNFACGHKITRDFSQNSSNKVKPYTKHMMDDGSQDGYFIICNNEEGDSMRCGYNDTYAFIAPNDCETSYSDKNALGGNGALKNRIKSYTDETDWSYQQVNNEFLRRLKLNSRYIWRHKGTIEGLEMVLGMFGMKSKRWIDAQPQWVKDCYQELNITYDYDIQEYTSFTSRIDETWDAIHQDYRINWINSTKAITYDNRFVSNYNKYGASDNIRTYQGIPVGFREAYISQEGDDAYLSYGEGDDKTYYRDEKNERIIKRYLYPNFDKNEQLDGNPYYQMNGGWLSKMIVNEDDEENKVWNFQFDVDNNIVYNKYIRKGEVDEDGFTVDNKPLFKETIRNIRRVDGIGNLLSIPTIELYNGVICNVTRIEKNSAVIDNVVYPITKIWHNVESTEGDDDEPTSGVREYISLVKRDGFIKVGNNKFFDTNIIVYDIDGNEFNCGVEDKSDGYELKAYIKDGTFICKEDAEGNYSISNFQILDDMPIEGYTNYFVLDDINYADVLARFDTETSEWTSGWRKLSVNDEEYLKINTIMNYYKGNNPHNGNMVYDNGHEYFTYFNRIFKYAADNDLFDERCYEDYFDELDNNINHYRFNGLIEENEDILQYDDFLVPDTKIHYFGNYKTKKGDAKTDGVPNIDKVWIYGDDTYRISGTPIDTEDENEEETVNGIGGYDKIYLAETENIEHYNLSASTDEGWVEKDNPYNLLDSERYPIIDEMTNQIVNNKIFDITFTLHNVWYTKKGQEELKYIDDIVMNYLTQVIPSTTILRVKYKSPKTQEVETQSTNEENG